SYFESDKYQSYASTDGGVDPTTYEVGTNLTLTPFLHGLVGYWPLNEGSGTTAYDKSGWGNEGVLTDASSTDTPFGPQWTTSGCLNGGSCLSFDGTGDYVVSANSTNGMTNQGTILLWFTSPSPGSPCPQGIVGGWISGRPDADLSCGAPASYVVQGGGGTWVSASYGFSANTWYFYAFTYGSAGYAYYVNGNLVGHGTTPTSANDDRITIGARNDGSGYLNGGKIYSVFVYKAVLTAGQIKAVYNVENP
ncbi:MAG: LamG domain-containing protein, partial [Patescibacteria group bacterium]|nr:LamG domain-containing protein [Patescibacteria group bacterium]